MEGNLNNNVNSIPNNNYEPPKSNNGVKVLLVILILLVLCLIGLTCYKMFIYDKKNDNKQNSNVVEEKEDNKPDNNIVEEKNNDNLKLSAELEEKIKDNFEFADYVKILNSNKVPSKEEVYYYTIKKIEGCDPMECKGKYDYNKMKEYENVFNEKYSHEFDGQTLYAVYNMEDIEDSVRELYGSNVKLNFENKEVVSISNMYPTKVLYVKDINKFGVYIGGGGMVSDGVDHLKLIVDTTLKDNIYSINYIDTKYRAYLSELSDDKYCYIVGKNNNKINNECYATEENWTSKKDEIDNKIKSYSLSHKDELPQYEVSFKINTDNTYEFNDIKKIN